MMPDRRFAVRPRVDGDEVDPQWEPRQWSSVGEVPGLQERRERPSHRLSLAVVEALLRQPEVPPAAPSHLDHDELRGRARVDRDDVELTTPHAQIPAERLPALCGEAFRDQLLGLVAERA
jgi:hypothetical protein